jgi:ATP-dependent DNA helicase Rep
LLYVGITRARHSLTFTYARARRRGKELCDCQPSRFLEELPQDDLQWEDGGKKQTPEERLASGKSHLAGLRNLLGDS